MNSDLHIVSNKKDKDEDVKTKSPEQLRELVNSHEIKTSDVVQDQNWYKMYDDFSKVESELVKAKKKESEGWKSVQWLISQCLRYFSGNLEEITTNGYYEHQSHENVLIRAGLLYADDPSFDNIRSENPAKVVSLQQNKTRKGVSDSSLIDLLIDESD